jgi:hypothetical protein
MIYYLFLTTYFYQWPQKCPVEIRTNPDLVQHFRITVPRIRIQKKCLRIHNTTRKERETIQV